MSRVVFVMEQHVGHYTYYLNLRHVVEQDGRITADWNPVTYSGASALLDRLPLPGSLRGSLQGMLQARRALAGPYEVAFFNTQVPAALAGRGLRRRPYVLATDITPVQYDGMSLLYGHRPDRGGPLARYKRRANTALFRGAARVLPWSAWARASLIDDYGVDPARIDVVPPGVDLGRWHPGARDGGAARFLFVGGDFYRKGGAALLEAFRSLPRGLAELHIVTRTPLDPEEGVRIYYDMRPNAPELIQLYQRSDVFVLPTVAEAFGIAAVEACASGLAVLATTVGGLADVVGEGENGFLIAPGDVDALARRMAAVAGDAGLRERLGRASRARAEQRFDAQRNAARVVGHLLEVARGPVVARPCPASDGR